FLDYFWTWRGIHLPLIKVVQSEVPFAKIYHAVSTGYAGLVGAIAKIMHRGKYFLTEHGIYTHERMLEIAQAGWIFEKEMRRYRAERELSFFKQWWVSTFQTMSRISYVHADRIFTLFEGNKMREILDGASPEKISIIPNGIEIQKFADFKREKKPAPQIALIGRVVAIKDIKTFIQAVKRVLVRFPDAQFYILGPHAEEEDYYAECKSLVEALHLEQSITFTGPVHVPDYLKFLDLVVLTSISEAQPYVILEAGIVGIPMVATDVGACREMLEGRSYEDQLLGLSGLVTQVANSNATAEAVIRLLTDKELYEQCSQTAIERAKRYYDLDDLLSRYLNIYEQNL
ncbi:MAG: GT4 family glycosyltransferase PelF, partial [bacterium]|nr:GT4 family glycosyltransferase PelF [bacterium]